MLQVRAAAVAVVLAVLAVSLAPASVSAQAAGTGVTVNSVLPGLHDTDRVRSVYADPDQRASALAGVPAGRLGDPAECAALVAFLCGQGAGFVTGAAIPVDGGAYQALL